MKARPGALAYLRNRFKLSQDGDAGFTLVEIAVALTLLMFVMIGLYSGSITSTKQNALSRDMTVATAIAEQQMTKLLTFSPAMVTASTDTLVRVLNGVTFSTTWPVAKTDTTADVTVTVAFSAQYGEACGLRAEGEVTDGR